MSSPRTGIRSIAVFEAAKGSFVLIAGFGLLTFIGRDAQEFAERLVHRMHLDPARYYPQVFIHAMSEVTNTHLLVMAGLAALYAAVRFAEAYGLWFSRQWAEWLAVLSGSIYVPVEIYEIWHHYTWLKLVMLIFNLCVVVYLTRVLLESRKAAAARKSAAPA